MLSLPQNFKVDTIDPYFTLVAKTHGGGVRPDYLNFLKQHCARIGINIDVIIQDYPTFIGELIAFRDYDICYFSFSDDGLDPDFSGLYSQSGSLNIWGYHADMDYNSSLGTGINEWYLEQGQLIVPSDSVERIQHYWAWEQYLMDEILPCQPTFAPKIYTALWSNLNNYSLKNNLKQSWGKMSFTGIHSGQLDSTKVVTVDNAWSDLNPIFQEDESSKAVSSMIMDKLFYFDADHSIYPHLAKTYSFINDTHLRIVLREGIKWQNDTNNLFTNEFLDARDVYFTLYAWKYLKFTEPHYNWIENMTIVDDFTLDIYIDGNPATSTTEAYAPALSELSVLILPEHYLNQTQAGDGVTPIITHESWNTFTTSCFGTSLFELDTFTEDIETELTIFDDCWWLNNSIDKSDMDFVNRFGTFNGGLDTWRIRIISDQFTALLEFESGKVDIVDVTPYPTKRDDFIANVDFDIQNETQFIMEFYGYNIRNTRPLIGNTEPCTGDPSMTKGLALRKAISYAVDRDEINDVIHRGEYTITDHPIYLKMGIWCNPNIIRYNHDLDLAREYMNKIGNFPTPTTTPNSPTSINRTYSNGSYVVGIPIVISSSVVIIGSLVLICYRRRNG